MVYSEEEKQRLIERFISGRLTADEKRQFNAFLIDPGFKEEVNFHKEVMETVKYREDKRFKDLLKEEEEAIEKEESGFVSKRFPTWGRIASIAAMLLIILICWQVMDRNDNNLFADYFEPYENTLYPVEKSESIGNIKENTFFLYERGSYEKTLSGFEKLLSEEENDDIAFYYANALLANEQIEKAIPILQKIILNNQSKYLIRAKWLLGLALVDQQEYLEAKQILESIQNDPFLKSEVERLLDESCFQTET